MILYGLKLWSSNTDLFAAAAALATQKKFDFVELYHQAGAALDYEKLASLQPANVLAIHHPHTHGFHELFFVNDEQRALWKKTQALADFFSVARIVLHPARAHTVERLTDILHELNDPRILIENMAGRDIYGEPMQCGQTLADLNQIKLHAGICFDLEKAVKAARAQGMDYQEFIRQALGVLQPSYFHLSSGDSGSAIDEHLNLWEGSIDLAWIKQELESMARRQDIWLVLETPKANGLDNDLKNLAFWHALCPVGQL